MHKLLIKPLSVNKAFTGTRHRTKDYDNFLTLIKYKLVNFKDDLKNIDFKKKDLKLRVDVIFGYSNTASDIDNGLKSFLDSLQKNLGFNDNKVYELNVRKRIVDKEDNEYIAFDITDISGLDEREF